mmetsp:Transcript_63860/g.181345  ORF Transcript_63860/g.181345 Transcript_63860/m.181345 type:complete len:235 (-) Transcript_63860:1140-1844(-)
MSAPPACRSPCSTAAYPALRRGGRFTLWPARPRRQLLRPPRPPRVRRQLPRPRSPRSRRARRRLQQQPQPRLRWHARLRPQRGRGGRWSMTCASRTVEDCALMETAASTSGTVTGPTSTSTGFRTGAPASSGAGRAVAWTRGSSESCSRARMPILTRCGRSTRRPGRSRQPAADAWRRRSPAAKAAACPCRLAKRVAATSVGASRPSRSRTLRRSWRRWRKKSLTGRGTCTRRI